MKQSNKTRKIKITRSKPNIKLTPESNTIIMSTLDHLSGYFQDAPINKELIHHIFNNIESSLNNADKLNIKPVSIPIQHSSEIPLKESYFVDKRIVDSISKLVDYLTTFSFRVNDSIFVDVRLYYSHLDIRKLKQRIKYIIAAIHFCASQCSYSRSGKYAFDIYFGDNKKGFSGGFNNKIEPYHVNSGLTFVDPTIDTSRIIIFRTEEWFKTLLHECVHCFNLDIQSHKINFKKLFEETFYINSDMIVNEAITELWARFINCAFFTYCSLTKNMSVTDFVSYFTLNINIERAFSIYQSQKLLNRFGLEYEYLVDATKAPLTKKLYNENTNAFCYYVMTSLLFSDLGKTINWLTNKSNTELSFSKSERDVIVYSYYIKSQSKNPDMMKLYKEFNKLNLGIPGLKMSAFEMSI